MSAIQTPDIVERITFGLKEHGCGFQYDNKIREFRITQGDGFWEHYNGSIAVRDDACIISIPFLAQDNPVITSAGTPAGVEVLRLAARIVCKMNCNALAGQCVLDTATGAIVYQQYIPLYCVNWSDKFAIINLLDGAIHHYLEMREEFIDAYQAGPGFATSMVQARHLAVTIRDRVLGDPSLFDDPDLRRNMEIRAADPYTIACKRRIEAMDSEYEYYPYDDVYRWVTPASGDTPALRHKYQRVGIRFAASAFTMETADSRDLDIMGRLAIAICDINYKRADASLHPGSDSDSDPGADLHPGEDLHRSSDPGSDSSTGSFLAPGFFGLRPLSGEIRYCYAGTRDAREMTDEQFASAIRHAQDMFARHMPAFRQIMNT